jgi:hypothetical protein
MTLLQELSQNNGPIYQIYCDLDGVLADFDARFEHFTGISPREYEETAIQQLGSKKGKEKFWNLIDEQIGVRFWRGIPLMPGALELWNYLKPHVPIILTAPSRNEVSKIGKRLWVQDNLGTGIPIVFKQAQQKTDLASPTSILIDDRLDNIQSWKSKNGIGILYEGDIMKIIRELQKMGI